MAKLPDSLLSTIFELFQQLAVCIEEAAAAEWVLYEQYGENSDTIEELEELQNAIALITKKHRAIAFLPTHVKAIVYFCKTDAIALSRESYKAIVLLPRQNYFYTTS